MTGRKASEDSSTSPPYLGFGVAGIGGGLMVQAPGLLLMIYMTDTLAIPAALAGLAMFAPRMLDVISDPIMGLISDRTKTRWGRRRPYLLVGAILAGLSACFLFTAPLFESVNLRLAYVVTFYVLMILGATIFTVPYMAMASEMTSDYHKRTKLMSTRAFFVFVGLVSGGVLAPMLVSEAGGGREGYAVMSIGLGIIVGGSFLAAFWGTRNARFHPGDEKKVSLREQLRIVTGNSPFRLLMFSFLSFTFGMGCAATLVPYFASYTLQQSDLMPILWGTSQLASILSIPLWTYLARRLEKHNVFKIGLVLIACGAIGCYFSDVHVPIIMGLWRIRGYRVGLQRFTGFYLGHVTRYHSVG